MIRFMEEKQPKLKPVCDECESDEVLADASAEWDSEQREWVLASTYDNMTCQDCNDDCHIKWEDA